jgi:hypothetical protein
LPNDWPALPLEDWIDTYATLHLWTQIVGKVRLAQSAWVNHSWHSTLYVTARGLTTSPIPHGSRMFQIDFDFIGHRLVVECTDGTGGGFALEPQSVATFYARLMAELERLGLGVKIHRKPNEVAAPIPFDQDRVHAAYDREYANRFWRVLVQADRVFKRFRARPSARRAPCTTSGALQTLPSRDSQGGARPSIPAACPTCPIGSRARLIRTR